MDRRTAVGRGMSSGTTGASTVGRRTTRSTKRSLATLGLLVLVACSVVGCSQRTWRKSESVFRGSGVTVELERRVVAGESVAMFDHPASVDAAEVARALRDLRFEEQGLFGESEPTPVLDPGALPVVAEAIAVALGRATESERVRFHVRGNATSLYVLPTITSTRGVAFVDAEGALDLVFDELQETRDPNDTGIEPRWGDPTSPRRRTAARLLLPDYARFGRDHNDRAHPLWAQLPLDRIAQARAAASAPAAAGTVTPRSPQPSSATGEKLTDAEILDRLRFLEELHREGRIADEQYETKRAELLAPSRE